MGPSIGNRRPSAAAAYWQAKAASLDPDSYMLLTEKNLPVTVPKGETWYALNLWNIATTDGETTFLRTADAADTLALSAGTTLRLGPKSTFAVAYVSRPALVTNQERYQTAARRLYYRRLMRLGRLPQQDISARIDKYASEETKGNTPFPEDFEEGMIVLASVHDVAWVTLNPSGMNLFNEVSDNHQNRVAEAIMVPFRRSDFTGIQVRAASVSGEKADFSATDGVGSVRFVRLPANW